MAYSDIVQGANLVDYDVDQYLFPWDLLPLDSAWVQNRHQAALEVTLVGYEHMDKWVQYWRHSNTRGFYRPSVFTGSPANVQQDWYEVNSGFYTEIERLDNSHASRPPEEVEVYRIPFAAVAGWTPTTDFSGAETIFSLPRPVRTVIGVRYRFIDDPITVGAKTSRYTFLKEGNGSVNDNAKRATRFIVGVTKQSADLNNVALSDILLGHVVERLSATENSTKLVINGEVYASGVAGPTHYPQFNFFSTNSSGSDPLTSVHANLASLEVSWGVGGAIGEGLPTENLSPVLIPVEDIQLVELYEFESGVGSGDFTIDKSVWFDAHTPPAGAKPVTEPEAPPFWTAHRNTYEVP